MQLILTNMFVRIKFVRIKFVTIMFFTLRISDHHVRNVPWASGCAGAPGTVPGSEGIRTTETMAGRPTLNAESA
jgi:hypothetical protein